MMTPPWACFLKVQNLQLVEPNNDDIEEGESSKRRRTARCRW